jgi:hypothetical protein
MGVLLQGGELGLPERLSLGAARLGAGALEDYAEDLHRLQGGVQRFLKATQGPRGDRGVRIGDGGLVEPSLPLQLPRDPLLYMTT